MRSETLPITLVVLTFDENIHLLELFRQVFVEPVAGRPAEVIVVHNGGQNPTLEWCEQAQTLSPVPFTLEVALENNLGRSRAWAVEHASQPLVAFVDGDCQLPVGWLKQLYQRWLTSLEADPQTAGIGGPNRLSENSALGATLNLMLESRLGHGGSAQAWRPRDLAVVDHLPTTNALFLQSAILKVGNFSSHFRRTCEDVDLGLRLTQQGFHLALAPSPEVTNHCAHDWQEWGRRMFRFGQAQARDIAPLRVKPHLPSLFSAVGVTALGLMPFIALIAPSVLWLIPAYGVLLTVESSSLGRTHHRPREFFRLLGAFALTHFAYGLGSCSGFGARWFRLQTFPLKMPSKKSA